MKLKRFPIYMRDMLGPEGMLSSYTSLKTRHFIHKKSLYLNEITRLKFIKIRTYLGRKRFKLTHHLKLKNF